MWIVYCATYKDGTCYVGQTMRTLQKRIASHYSTRSYFGSVLNKTPRDDWDWSILKECKTLEEASHWECYFIAEKNCLLEGYNAPIGHNGRLTKESLAKMSKAKSGFIPWNKGKQSAYTDKTIEAMRASALGRLSKRSKQGELNRIEGCKKLGKPVINLLTKEEYWSVGDAARKLGVASSTVKRVLNGKIKESALKIKYKHLT